MQLKPIMGTATVAISLLLACALPAQAAPVNGQGTWETTLLGRDINRHAVSALDASAVYLYDTVQNITWVRDANLNGAMGRDDAIVWAANLTTGTGTNAVTDWRLPSMTDTGTPGCNWSYNGTDCGFNTATSTNEMASLFFNTLGNKSYLSTSGVYQADFGLTNTASFQNMLPQSYWLGTAYAPDPLNASWAFSFSNGSQGVGYANNLYMFNAMAVRNGDVLLAPVPEPETYAMLLAGLGVMSAVARRRKAKQA